MRTGRTPHVVVVCAVVASLTSSSCLALAIVDTHHETLDETTVDVRPTSRRAGLNDDACFVETRQRVDMRLHVSRTYALFGLVEVLLVAASSGASSRSNLDLGLGAAGVLDGLLTVVYTVRRDGAVSTKEHWQQSNQTGPCAR